MGLGRARLPQKIARLPAHREGALWERGGGVSGSEETFSWRRPAQRENRGHQDQPALVAVRARTGALGFGWVFAVSLLRVLARLLQVEGGPETLLADRVNGEPQGCDLVESLAEPAKGLLVDVDPDARLLRHAHRSF